MKLTHGISAALAVAAVLSANTTMAAQPKSAAVITTKLRAVSPYQRISGRLVTNGYAVLLVKADLPGCLWWVQEPVQMMHNQVFRGEARFGNHQTPTGTKFKLVVLVVKDQDTALSYEPGDSMKVLPIDIPRSAEMDVIVRHEARDDENDEKAEIRQLEFSGVGYDAEVRYVHEITGRIENALRPVVLVRPGNSQANWWVQEPAVIGADGESFSVRARFGNTRTPLGTEFRVVILLPESGSASKIYEAGSQIKKLPAGVARTKIYRVKLGKPQVTVAAEQANTEKK